MERSGHSIQQILDRMDEIKRKVVLIFTLDNLEFARINGRVSALQSILSSMLKNQTDRYTERWHANNRR